MMIRSRCLMQATTLCAIGISCLTVPALAAAGNAPLAAAGNRLGGLAGLPTADLPRRIKVDIPEDAETAENREDVADCRGCYTLTELPTSYDWVHDCCAFFPHGLRPEERNTPRLYYQKDDQKDDDPCIIIEVDRYGRDHRARWQWFRTASKTELKDSEKNKCAWLWYSNSTLSCCCANGWSSLVSSVLCTVGCAPWQVPCATGVCCGVCCACYYPYGNGSPDGRPKMPRKTNLMGPLRKPDRIPVTAANTYKAHLARRQRYQYLIDVSISDLTPEYTFRNALTKQQTMN